ncbi:MAG TPA: hypothetical protein VK590_03575 [Saprospiraceae bacterium]|nr:hypothetical protein [Saprospiraceae bacterium]
MKPALKSFIPILFITLLSIITLSCKKEYCTPDCIATQISQIKNNNVPGEASIKEYWFQNKIVYYIDPGPMYDDQDYDVINTNCEVIGHLLGLWGNEVINGEDFFKNAKLVRVVWKR